MWCFHTGTPHAVTHPASNVTAGRGGGERCTDSLVWTPERMHHIPFFFHHGQDVSL